MGGFSLWHILIVAILILLLFGGNRFSAMMGDVAKGLKSFKQGLSDEDKAAAEQKQIPPQQQPIDITPKPEQTATPPGDDQSRS
jgi:sec-independent protein translocase protein TatA